MITLRDVRSMLEDDFQERIRKLIKERGLIAEHVTNSLAGRTWCPGWPDLCIVGTRLIYRELKAMGQDLSPTQRDVRKAIIAAGGDYATWWPIHLLDGTIERELDAITERKAALWTRDSSSPSPA